MITVVFVMSFQHSGSTWLNAVLGGTSSADHHYYADLDWRRSASNRRWLSRIPDDFAQAAIGSPYATSLPARFGNNWQGLASPAAGSSAS